MLLSSPLIAALSHTFPQRGRGEISLGCFLTGTQWVLLGQNLWQPVSRGVNVRQRERERQRFESGQTGRVVVTKGGRRGW